MIDGPASWTAIALIVLVVVHRTAAHGGASDVEPTTGKRPWTTLALVGLHIVHLTVAVTAGWMGWWEPNAAVSLVGVGLVLAGVGVTWSARRTLGEHFSIFLTDGEEHELITGGLYDAVRHPIYTGELLVHVGAVLLTAAWVVAPLPVLTFGVLTLRMNAEEELLQARYPEYSSYVQRTGRLLPRLRRPQPPRDVPDAKVGSVG